jgi:hypothetical protein
VADHPPGPAPTPHAGALDDALRQRLTAVAEEGRDLWHRFDHEVRQKRWHPFVPADYDAVLVALAAARGPGLRFLEWGSAAGVITILADLLGFEAYGIELDDALVAVARELAARHGSGARFQAGSFIPAGYRWRPRDGDGRIGTLGVGTSAYPALGHPLDDFDVVFAYPWGGEEALMVDLMRQYGAPDALLLLQQGNEGVVRYRRGRRIG